MKTTFWAYTVIALMFLAGGAWFSEREYTTWGLLFGVMAELERRRVTKIHINIDREGKPFPGDPT